MILRRAALASCFVLLAACDSGDGNRGDAMAQVANTEWHRKDLNAHLARWLAVAPMPSGLLQGQFDRSWQPAKQVVGDLTLHSRLVYTMLVGYEATGDARYLEAARRGADFMLAHFHDPVHGGFFQNVDAVGKPVSTARPVACGTGDGGAGVQGGGTRGVAGYPPQSAGARWRIAGIGAARLRADTRQQAFAESGHAYVRGLAGPDRCDR
jgi:hypothetical protein